MATIRQIESARQNGRRSKGAVTAVGKARSSQNALKHGIHSSAVVLNSEQGELYDQLLNVYIAEYQPANAREHDLIESIVDARWRLNRVLTMEAAALDYEIDQQRAKPDLASGIDEGTRAALAFARLAASSGSMLSLLNRHEGRLRRTIDRALDRLAELQKCRNEPDATTTPAA